MVHAPVAVSTEGWRWLPPLHLPRAHAASTTASPGVPPTFRPQPPSESSRPVHALLVVKTFNWTYSFYYYARLDSQAQTNRRPQFNTASQSRRLFVAFGLDLCFGMCTNIQNFICNNPEAVPPTNYSSTISRHFSSMWLAATTSKFRKFQTLKWIHLPCETCRCGSVAWNIRYYQMISRNMRIVRY